MTENQNYQEPSPVKWYHGSNRRNVYETDRLVARFTTVDDAQRAVRAVNEQIDRATEAQAATATEPEPAEVDYLAYPEDQTFYGNYSVMLRKFIDIYHFFDGQLYIAKNWEPITLAAAWPQNLRRLVADGRRVGRPQPMPTKRGETVLARLATHSQMDIWTHIGDGYFATPAFANIHPWQDLIDVRPHNADDQSVVSQTD